MLHTSRLEVYSGFIEWLCPTCYFNKPRKFGAPRQGKTDNDLRRQLDRLETSYGPLLRRETEERRERRLVVQDRERLR